MRYFLLSLRATSIIFLLFPINFHDVAAFSLKLLHIQHSWAYGYAVTTFDVAVSLFWLI
jgi:hypothetical protein